MPAANADPSINFGTYECKSNEVIIYCPVYNKSTGLYGGLTKILGYITLRGNLNERFQKEKRWLSKREKFFVLFFDENCIAKCF